MIAAYVLGLPYGPNGVAFAYSAVMTVECGSPYCMVHTWHNDFLERYLEGVESTSYFGNRGGSACLYLAKFLWRLAFSISAAFVRSRYCILFIPLDAFVCHGTEGVLLGSS